MAKYTFYYPYYPYNQDYKYGYEYPHSNYYNKYDYLYYTYAKVCHVVLEELGVPYEAKMVYYKDGANQEYAQYSPEGQMPMLAYEGYKYYDSMAIMDYLFNTYSSEKLMPKTYPERYKVYQAMMYMNTYVYSTYSEIFTAKKYYKDQATYTAVQESLRQRLYKYYDEMEQYLSKNKYYAGETYSVADIMFAVMAEFAPYAGLQYKYGKYTQQYLDAIYSLPSYKAATQQETYAASEYHTKAA